MTYARRLASNLKTIPKIGISFLLFCMVIGRTCQAEPKPTLAGSLDEHAAEFGSPLDKAQVFTILNDLAIGAKNSSKMDIQPTLTTKQLNSFLAALEQGERFGDDPAITGALVKLNYYKASTPPPTPTPAL